MLARAGKKLTRFNWWERISSEFSKNNLRQIFATVLIFSNEKMFAESGPGDLPKTA